MVRRSFPAIALALLFSCSLFPPAKNGVISVRIGGAVPRILAASLPGTGAASRLILNGTARVRLSATVNGETIESLTDYAGAGTLASLGGLPIGVSLAIRAETLDSSGATLTAWAETLTLQAGVNRVSAVLRPETGSVAACAADLSGLASIDLAQGAGAFYSVSFSSADAPDSVNEYQIIANTHTFRSCWLGVYDADWNPLTPVAQDRERGWIVIDVPQNGGTVNVAVSAPDGARTATLQARKARFYATEADGGRTGGLATSASPRLVFQGGLLDGQSCFIKAGEYSGMMTWNSDLCVYGGFSHDSWTVRNPASYTTQLKAGLGLDQGIAVDVRSTGTGYVDGMRIRARDFYTNDGQHTGLSLSTALPFVVRDCQLYGPGNYGYYDTHSAKALAIAAGTPEIAGCRIDGGIGLGSIGVESIYISGSGTRPFIYASEITGGYSASTGMATTKGVSLASGSSAVMNRCSIFGGVAVSGSTDPGYFSLACGISLPALLSDNVIIANSIVSGGYSSGTDVAPGRIYGITSDCLGSDNIPVVVNCTLDVGTALPADRPKSESPEMAAFYSTSNVGKAILSGNVFIDSSQSANSLAIRVGYDSTNPDRFCFARFAGNTAFGPFFASDSPIFRINLYLSPDPIDSSSLLNYPNSYTTTAYANNITHRTSPTRSDVFTAYGMGRLEDSEAASGFWLEDNDWRPKPSMAAHFASTYDPVSSGDIPAADVAKYPELQLDRAGRPRTSGAWARGAYEP